MVIYLTGAISGAHLNPAIALAFAVIGNLPKQRLAGSVRWSIACSGSRLFFVQWGGGVYRFRSMVWAG